MPGKNLENSLRYNGHTDIQTHGQNDRAGLIPLLIQNI